MLATFFMEQPHGGVYRTHVNANDILILYADSILLRISNAALLQNQAFQRGVWKQNTPRSPALTGEAWVLKPSLFMFLSISLHSAISIACVMQMLAVHARDATKCLRLAKVNFSCAAEITVWLQPNSPDTGWCSARPKRFTPTTCQALCAPFKGEERLRNILAQVSREWEQIFLNPELLNPE